MQIAPPVPHNWLVLPVRQVPLSQQPVQVAGEHTLTHEPFWHCWFCPHEETQRNCPVLSTWQTSHLLVSHVTPQPPQLVTVFSSLQTPPQQLRLPVQVETHWPAPVVGLTLHTSHLDGSHAVARQVLPQTLVLGQQAPARQVSLAPHDLPQRPQFCSSSKRFLQTPEQHASPAVVLQASAHSPQLLLSF